MLLQDVLHMDLSGLIHLGGIRTQEEFTAVHHNEHALKRSSGTLKQFGQTTYYTVSPSRPWTCSCRSAPHLQ